MQLHYIPDRVELKFCFSKNVNKWETFQTTLIEAKHQLLLPPPTPPTRLNFFAELQKLWHLTWKSANFCSWLLFYECEMALLVSGGFCGPAPWSVRAGAALLLYCRFVLQIIWFLFVIKSQPEKGEVVLVPPKLSQCPWHDACGSCLICHCWQLKHKHIVIFLDETVQTFQNSLCMQICMLSESTTHAHGIYGKCWEIWKEIVWEVVLFFWT